MLCTRSYTNITKLSFVTYSKWFQNIYVNDLSIYCIYNKWIFEWANIFSRVCKKISLWIYLIFLRLVIFTSLIFLLTRYIQITNRFLSKGLIPYMWLKMIVNSYIPMWIDDYLTIELVNFFRIYISPYQRMKFEKLLI